MSVNTGNSNENYKVGVFDQFAIRDIVQVVLVPILMIAVAYMANPDLKQIENFKAVNLFQSGLGMLGLSSLCLLYCQFNNYKGCLFFLFNEVFVFSYSLAVTISFSYFWVENSNAMLLESILLAAFAIWIRFPFEKTNFANKLDKKYSVKKTHINSLIILLFCCLSFYLFF